MKRIAPGLGLIACLVASPLRAQAGAPWIDAPVGWGPASQYTCVTRPTGMPMPPAFITCDPNKFYSFPPFAQEFLLDHEHGHVYQIVYNPSILYGPYAEYDADCYGAIVMAGRNPQGLAATVAWLVNVVGYQAKDATHGNGFEMAQRIRECAARVGVTLGQASWSSGSSMAVLSQAAPGALLASGAAKLPAGLEVVQPQNPKLPVDYAAYVSRGPDPLPTRSADFCTALESVAEAAHSWFWEQSTQVGQLRPEIADVLGGNCTVSGTRDRVTCTGDTGTTPLSAARVHACLHQSDWVPVCGKRGCDARVEYFHHAAAKDHESIAIEVVGQGTTVTIAAPAFDSHGHSIPSDPDYKPAAR